MRGATLQIDVNIIDTSKCHFFQWRQFFSIRDQRRRYLPWHGVPAAGLYDPQPPDDDKAWYWTDSEWLSHASGDGASARFYDRPQLYYSNINHDVTRVTNSFILELVHIRNLSQKGWSPGEVVLRIKWGYWYTLIDHQLIH